MGIRVLHPRRQHGVFLICLVGRVAKATQLSQFCPLTLMAPATERCDDAHRQQLGQSTGLQQTSTHLHFLVAHPQAHPSPPLSCPCLGQLTCLDCIKGLTRLLVSLCMWPVGVPAPLQETPEREEREVRASMPQTPPAEFPGAGCILPGLLSRILLCSNLFSRCSQPSIPVCRPRNNNAPLPTPTPHLHPYKDGHHSTLLYIWTECAIHFLLKPD